MRRLLALGCLAAPAAAPGPRQNTSWAGASRALVSTARDLDWFWGHNGAVPGYQAHAYTDGRRSAVVPVTGDDRTERQDAAVNRAIDKALCS